MSYEVRVFFFRGWTGFIGKSRAANRKKQER